MKSPDAQHGSSILEQLASSPESRRGPILLEYLSGLVDGILDTDATETRTLSAEDQLFETGLSSLFIVELKNALEADFDTELPLTLFFTYADVGGLVAHLLERVSTDNVTTAGAPRGGQQSTAIATESGASDPATDEPDDLEAALLRKIAAVEKKL